MSEVKNLIIETPSYFSIVKQIRIITYFCSVFFTQMVRPKYISINLKTQVSAWLLMVMVLGTIVPFNLFHNHTKENSPARFQTSQAKEVENHHSCKHQVHLAQEQEMCFLCHFSFIPVFETGSLAVLGKLPESASIIQNTLYSNCYSFISVYSVLNKGSPVT